MNRSALIAAILYAYFLSGAIAQNSERFSIEVFKYAVDGSGDPEMPVKILTTRFSILAQELCRDHPNFSTLQELKVVENNSQPPPTLNDWANYWRNAQNVLEVLQGTVFAKDNPTTIDTDVYVGELQGSLKSKIMTIHTEVKSENYSRFLNLHCALTLYALAMDAKRLNSDRGVISQYLAEAKSLLSDGGPDGGVARQILEDAVMFELLALKAKSNKP